MDFDVIVAGSGLPAAAAASALLKRGLATALVEEPEPAASGPSAEFGWYSAWWPGADAGLDRLARAGIDALEREHAESGGAFGLSRRGQLFVTARKDVAVLLRNAAGRHAAADGGPLREHAGAEWYLPGPADGIRGVPGGIDLLESGALRTVFPFLGPRIRVGVHVRRAGLVDRAGLRRWLLAGCRDRGGRVIGEAVIGVERGPGDRGWLVRVADGRALVAPSLVLAGPRARRHAKAAGAVLSWAEWVRVTAVLGGGRAVLGPAAPIVIPADLAPSLNPAEPVAGLAPESGIGLPSCAPLDDGSLRLEGTAPPGTRPEGIMALGENLLRTLAGVIPALETRRGPPGSLAIGSGLVVMSSDLRPIVGSPGLPGVHFLIGFGAGVTHLLAAAAATAAAVQVSPDRVS